MILKGRNSNLLVVAARDNISVPGKLVNRQMCDKQLTLCSVLALMREFCT